MRDWRERYRRQRAEQRATVAGILLDCARVLCRSDGDLARPIIEAAAQLIWRAAKDASHVQETTSRRAAEAAAGS